ncbi:MULTISPECIES: zinc-binding dehydrogenase [Bifidobacterium]|jgi:alcohol dehydrogenase|uniref:IMP dehydrogenase n=1 Tax=Bifidobacterium tibiigranuli TaxID=2172043 RepID=A0A5N6S5T5_9BIFI|nr:zinc-binding dehydrogenase [Bifidobacterium tibiigranuli]KAE8128470.1 IMP dehydrogenase [Bifidobacterium tibiigranuli]KAE8128514.1 IMP dehydrogenase [Bifidobacterium tibiigranuli]
MKAAVYHGNHTISLDEVLEPTIKHPTDAIVDIEYAGVCGSDLWTYRDQGAAAPNRIGHEFVGAVREVGGGVRSVRPGDWVIVPFRYSDGTCGYCRKGLETSCVNGGFWGRETADAGQGEAACVPFADGTLVKALPDGSRPDERLIPSLLTLSDVFTTGYHAAVSAHVSKGDVVTVVGDGAVGLCAIMAAKMLGASCVINAGSSHADRNALARSFGADQIITARGDEAVDAVAKLTSSEGSDVVLECVGSAQSFDTALRMCTAGGTVGYVGLPHGVAIDAGLLFRGNITVAGGMSPAHHYIADTMPAVLSGEINPGMVYTKQYPLSDIALAYDDMDHRRTIKPLIRVR